MHWGAVPFITSLVKNPFTMNDATLTPVSEIEATLISDLKECINLLPASWSGQDLARARVEPPLRCWERSTCVIMIMRMRKHISTWC